MKSKGHDRKDRPPPHILIVKRYQPMDKRSKTVFPGHVRKYDLVLFGAFEHIAYSVYTACEKDYESN
jgi:hypothetical protein